MLCDADCTHLKKYCKSTSRWGHGFGALIGLLTGVFILKNRKVEPWEQKLKIVAFVLSGVLAGSLVIWHLLGGADWFEVLHSSGSTHCDPAPFCSFDVVDQESK